MLSFIAEKVANNQNPASISSRFRERRFSTFLKQFNINSNTTILDVGGTAQTWEGTGLEENVVLLNIFIPKAERTNPKFRYVQGNALNMNMFDDKSFDLVFSNSVIEHVGSFENQQKFAAEIQRVGKSYWIQTPNKQFPIEPHFLFPFFQYLPARFKKEVAIRWKYSHFKKWGKDDEHILEEAEKIRLLHRQELSQVFESPGIYEEKLLGMTKSLVAYKKPSIRYQAQPTTRHQRTAKVA